MYQRDENLEQVLATFNPPVGKKPTTKPIRSPSELSTCFRTAFSHLTDDETRINYLTRLLTASRTSKSSGLPAAIRHNVMYALETTIPTVEDSEAKLHLYFQVLELLEQENNYWVRDFGARTLLGAKQSLTPGLVERLRTHLSERFSFYQKKVDEHPELGEKTDLEQALDLTIKAYNDKLREIEANFYDPAQEKLELDSRTWESEKGVFERLYGIKLSDFGMAMELDEAEKKAFYVQNVSALKTGDVKTRDKLYPRLVKRTEELLAKERTLAEKREEKTEELLEQKMQENPHLVQLQRDVDEARAKLNQLSSLLSYQASAKYLSTLLEKFST